MGSTVIILSSGMAITYCVDLDDVLLGTDRRGESPGVRREHGGIHMICTMFRFSVIQ